ncbi:ATP-binding protein [Lysobacter koreensis]|uniref:Oxygen sensor histidine kinase NreB n=1 Tax=Lysobacter koreensis TaxID=266122 RepID=A0ABW2YQ71_9GAMM
MPAAATPPTTTPGWALLREFARLLLLAVVLPVLALAGLIQWQDANDVREQFGARIATAAESNGRDVDNFLQTHLAAMQLLAERRTAAGDLDDQAAWAADLIRIQRHYPAFARLLVTDAEGKTRLIQPALPGALGTSVADRDYFREPRRSRRAFVSDVFRGRVLSNPQVAMSVPLFANGRFAGVVSGSMGIGSLAILRGQALQPRGFEVLLLDRANAVVHASDGLRYRSLDVLGQAGGDRLLRELDSRHARMQPLPGVLRDGGDAYALAMPLKVGWRLLLLVPERVVAAELRRHTLVMLGLLALVLLGVLAIVGLQMQRLGGSVHGLLERMQRFALDRASAPVALESMPRELVPLAEAMNQLAARAHEAYGEVSLSLQEQSRLREELQAVARRLMTVQEDERRTLSRELHDDIGQAITAIKLGAMALQDDDDPARRAEILAEIVTITDHTVAKLRNLSLLLRPPQLDTLGLETALRWQADTLFRAGQPRLELALTELPGRPDPEVELACFRIAQEALTNILRHAGAKRVTLTLAPVAPGDALVLTIGDDGRGFDPARGHGLGLVTMRERAQQLGGTLEIDTGEGRGTCIRATLPMRSTG